MKIKKEWDLILSLTIPMMIIGAYFLRIHLNLNEGQILFSKGLIAIGILFSVYEYSRQKRVHTKIYELVKKDKPITPLFTGEILEISKSYDLWAYYNVNGLDIGVKVSTNSNYSNLILEPKELIKKINSNEIHLRGLI